MKNSKQYVLSFILLVEVLIPVRLCAQSDKLIYHQIFAPGEGFFNRLEKEFRNEICLNGLWDFQAVQLPADYQPGKGIVPELPLPKDDAWDHVKIKIPSPWNINGFANRNLEGPDHRNYPSYPKEWEDVKMAWMKKMIQIPTHWTDQIIKLHFEAVSGYTEVYVNRQKIGENFDIFLPFDMDITSVVKPGEWVEVLVGVRNQSLFEDRSTIGRRIIPAGSMWGYHVSGIWQDVYLLSLPKINVEDIYVKPLVSEGVLEVDITLMNHSDRKENLSLNGIIKEWINRAGTDVHTAPVPNWELGRQITDLSSGKIQLQPKETLTTTLTVPVTEGMLAYWTPEHPNLYSLIVTLHSGKNKVDTKYQRFGWREWTIQGTNHYLNGNPYQLKGDSWHFMGIPQLTRRYAWAWFTAIKAANGNAVRPHAQVYPRFYLEMADELGICVLDETAIWASDGGPKMDSPIFWENCRKHIERLVLRDRNYPSIFGWSISNENKPVILHVFNRPDLMPLQKQAWEDWRNTVSANDPTRPWISSDGEDDGEGILPVTVGHYGDDNSMKEWVEIGKPWGIGEHSMAYYGTPEQVSVYNGERAYESQLGRMEGLANECYHLIANQRKMGASYVSIFNLAWYALKPLPLGKKELASTPSLANDGVFFTNYKDGMPGVQPERMGPYCTTFNPGYDPSLPLYEPWPLFDAIRAANAIDGPAWSPWMEVEKGTAETGHTTPGKYDDVLFVGTGDIELKQLLQNQGIVFSSKMNPKRHTIVIVDGKGVLTETQQKELKQHIKSGADVWVWGITPNGLSSMNEILPKSVRLDERKASSFIPASDSWFRGMKNSDFYFSEIQREEASEYGLNGDFVLEGEVMLDACNTDWRKWNKRPEELKTAAILRSENEAKGASPVFVNYQKDGSTYLVSTLTHFANTEKGSNSLMQILRQLGIPFDTSKSFAAEDFLDAQGFLLKAKRSPAYTGDKNRDFINKETNAAGKTEAMQTWNISFVNGEKAFHNANEGISYLSFWVFSPRPLDDLLIEPDVPKVDLTVNAISGARIWLNNKQVGDFSNDSQTQCKELPLQQGWNFFLIKTSTKGEPFSVRFQSLNRPEFMPLLKGSFSNPDRK
jgi:beta-galactosidase